ncbi:hypothetical protein K435DRAFT_872426 [Dendrothele bispora CBS 962.96]|uniref:intramembrane prenyl-peptidase Rce1 n=1 Tax=Dendrothele bispora (strain CBS 962.96) TaxID=1314807 RepID=A0A4S8L205_DENBC|nr:hypothetical protein K435DRAFT_872426 [Dendrothele bispora CBS 962.96]
MSTAVLSVTEAYFLSLAFTLVYVGSLYIFKCAQVARIVTTLSSCNNSRKTWSGRKKTEYELGMDEMRRLLQEEERQKKNGKGVPPPHKLSRNQFDRNDSRTVLTRLLCISLASILSFAILWRVVYVRVYERGYSQPGEIYRLTNYDWDNTSPLVSFKFARRLLGLRVGSLGVLKSLTYLLLPFVLVYALFRSLTRNRSNATPHSTYGIVLVLLRDFLVGPMTEEIVFRGCITAVFRLTKVQRVNPWSPYIRRSFTYTKFAQLDIETNPASDPLDSMILAHIVFISSFLYTIAHLHHGIGVRIKRLVTRDRRRSRYPLIKLTTIAVLQIGLGCLYTSIFVSHLSTPSIFSAILAHVFVNIAFHVTRDIGFEVSTIDKWINGHQDKRK